MHDFIEISRLHTDFNVIVIYIDSYHMHELLFYMLAIATVQIRVTN